MNVDVYLDERGEPTRVGTLRTYARGSTVSFEYEPEWIKTGYSIDPSGLPLQAGLQTSPSLMGAFSDCAPDRWGRKLIVRAVERGLVENKALQEVDYLLALEDRTRIGALRFKKDGSEFLGTSRGKIPPLLHINQLLKSALAVQRNKETLDDLKYLLGNGSPLGGARPKSAVVLADGRYAIAKFPKEDEERNIACGEVLALEMSRRCGIRTAEARYLVVEKRPVSVVTRFDRNKQGRIPFLSAASLLKQPSGDGSSYEAIAEAIREYGLPADVPELWKRCLFSLLICNQDDHLRNHGFLMVQRNRWELSPAYDLNPVPEIDRAHYHKTAILEDARESTVELALLAAKHFGIEHEEARLVLAEFVKVCGQWKSIGQQIGLKAADLNSYETAFENPWVEEARKL